MVAEVSRGGGSLPARIGVYVEEVPSTSKPIEGVGTSIAAFITPGVYVEEVPSTSKPIEGVGTAVAAFVGLAPGGPVNTPLRVSRWGQFAKIYGDPNEPDNGPFMEDAFLAHAVRGFFENGGTRCWVVRVGGATPQDFAGDAAQHRGLGTLAAIDEITMVCMPDGMILARDGDEAELTALQQKLVAHCEDAGNRMAIVDCPPGLSTREVLNWRTSGPGYDSKDAALYYPWLEVADPSTGRPLLVPPSGHVAGMWCRTDAGFGVHRAPTEGLVGVAGLGFDVTEGDQDELSGAGVNSIRAFPGQGIRVWGARTLSSDPEWRSVPVRRVFLNLASSIDQGTRWTVFEPNDERLWEGLRQEVEHFLQRSWRDGALAGETANDAYYVKCDAETNPPEVIEAGQIVCEIGIAPVKPREFAILRLSRIAADARPQREPAASSGPA
jgi:phage tail sheath protein FI